MAAILNGFLPTRKKEDKVLNTRWGDTGISAPMHGGWSAGAGQPESSPDLDRDLPPTPPQDHEVVDGVFIIHDEEEENRTGDEGADSGRDNASVTIPLPWKKKKATNTAALHNRKSSYPNSTVPNPRFAAPRRMDVMPALGTAEAAALPLPESRVNSPLGRTTTASPILTFRSRLQSPNLADILSPVAEGFAKDGPSTRPPPAASQTSYEPVDPVERTSSSSSIRSNTARRTPVPGYSTEGIGGMTMSSQATTEDQAPEFQRPASRGLGATAHMRASSRGPRASSRGPRSTSVEPLAYRANSTDPYNFRAQSVEPPTRRAPSVEPPTRRAPSVEPVARRAPSVEPFGRRAPSVEPIARRAPSVEPITRRAPSVEPISRRAPSVEPVSRRAPSVEPTARRAPSVDPYTRRAPSVEPFGRRAPSVEPIMHQAPFVEQYASQAPFVEPYGGSVQPVEPFVPLPQDLEAFYPNSEEYHPFIPPAHDLTPLRSRAPSVDPGRRRAPSVDPIASRRGISLEPTRQRAPSIGLESKRAPSVGPSCMRRAASKEPRGRRGMSVEPKPRVRFHSEAARRTRRDSFSSNDGELESDEGRDDSEREVYSHTRRFDPDAPPARRPRRRRSIASPLSSPTGASFEFARIANSVQSTIANEGFQAISSRSGDGRPVNPPMEKRAASRTRSQSRGARDIYADMQDDFSAVAREVQNVPPPPPPTEPTHIFTQIHPGILKNSQRAPSPVVYANGSVGSNFSDYDRNGYSSDSSFPESTSITGVMMSDAERYQDPTVAQAMYANFARDRQDHFLREERERSRQKLARKLERERDREAAFNVLGDCDSMSGMSGTEASKRGVGSVISIESKGEVNTKKTLVPNDEDIWG